MELNIKNKTFSKAKNIYDITIIGAGPIGIFSIFQSGMLRLKCCVIESLDFLGGQCSALYPEKPIYDIAGFPSIKAQSLINNLLKQSLVFHTDIFLNEKCQSIDKKDFYWEILTSKKKIETKTIIITAGGGMLEPRKPIIPNIEKYKSSIFYRIEKPNLFKDKTVTIVGGGDSALDWAIFLAKNIAKKIYLVHRREKFKSSPKMKHDVLELSKTGLIKLVTPYQLNKIEGTNNILKIVEVKDLEGNILKIKSDYLIIFFGLSKNIGPISDWDLIIKKKYIEVDPTTMQTNLKGVYAAGDICNYPGKLRLISVGFGECARACYSAYNYIKPDIPMHFEHSTNRGIPINL